MEEIINSSNIRHELTEKDRKILAPKDNKKVIPFSNTGKHVTPSAENQNRSKMVTIAKSTAIVILVTSIIFSSILGALLGYQFKKQEFENMSHWQESLIRSEAIADYKAQLEAEEAEQSALRMEELKDEGMRRKYEITLFAKLFEGVRNWNFDTNDLITYGICVWNRTRSSLFPDTVEEVILQDNQWVNFNPDTKVVADYQKVADNLVSLLYNSDVDLCSSKYCWIEIRDGHLYLKDSFEAYPGMTWWRYQG